MKITKRDSIELLKNMLNEMGLELDVTEKIENGIPKKYYNINAESLNRMNSLANSKLANSIVNSKTELGYKLDLFIRANKK